MNAVLITGMSGAGKSTIAEVLARDFEQKMHLAEGPRNRLRRRDDMSYFNPSPQEILAATLVIQADHAGRSTSDAVRLRWC